MNAENFMDSNVFVYLFDETDANKYQRARSLVREILDNETGCISFQVVRETLNVVGRIVGPDSDQLAQLLDEILIPLWGKSTRVNRSTAAASRYKCGTGSASTTRSSWRQRWKRAAPRCTARICRTVSGYRD